MHPRSTVYLESDIKICILPKAWDVSRQMSEHYRFPHKKKVTSSLTGREKEAEYVDPWGQDWDHNAEDVFCSLPSGKGGCKKSHDSALQWCMWVHRELQWYFLRSSPLAFSASFSINHFQDLSQDVHSRPSHDSFTHECHTETSSSKPPSTPTTISNSKICLLSALWSTAQIRVQLSTPHLKSQSWAWLQGHLHSWRQSPVSHDGHIPVKNKRSLAFRGPYSQPRTPCHTIESPNSAQCKDESQAGLSPNPAITLVADTQQIHSETRTLGC